jgi:hypothetical protein
MTGVRALLDKAIAESLMTVRYPEQYISHAIVQGCCAVADDLDRELIHLRRNRAVHEGVRQNAADFETLSTRLGELFNPSLTTHHGLDPEGTHVGGLIAVLEQAAGRLEAIPCTCREIGANETVDSKWRVEHPDNWESNNHWEDGQDDVMVCTRCAALGRVMDRKAPGWE